MEFFDVTELLNKLKAKKIKTPEKMSDEQFLRWWGHMLKTHGKKLNK